MAAVDLEQLAFFCLTRYLSNPKYPIIFLLPAWSVNYNNTLWLLLFLSVCPIESIDLPQFKQSIVSKLIALMTWVLSRLAWKPMESDLIAGGRQGL